MSEPQTMLEKVARAIWQAREKRMPGRGQRMEPDNWDMHSGAWASTLGDARAALEAMLEPTEGMKTAGMEAQSEEHWPDPWPLAKDGYELAPDYITAGLVWWHMITAALEGK